MPKPRRVANPKPHSERIGMGRQSIPDELKKRPINATVSPDAHKYYSLHRGLASKILQKEFELLKQTETY